LPSWSRQELSTGTPAIKVLQQHGPANLVGILGSSRCSLFDSGDPCTFCCFDGGDTNVTRSVEEIIEAFDLATEDKKGYNLTLSTGLVGPEDYDFLVDSVARLRQGIGDSALALEITPLVENEYYWLQELKAAGLDTLMVPLDCATEDSRSRFTPGKAQMLTGNYWGTVEAAVEYFGKGNVTSSIIVGLDPIENTLQAMKRMGSIGVVPEPVPVRWDDSLVVDGENYPLTNPQDLIKARSMVSGLFLRYFRGDFQKTMAGCAACGGCGGVSMNRV